MPILEGQHHAPNAKIAVVVSRFNTLISQNLLQGALNTLERQGQVKPENTTIVWVPGAIEIPLVAKRLAQSKQHDAVIALGCIIRGGTAHFDYVASACSQGLTQISLNLDVPVAFGVLTTDTMEQALERSGGKVGNKGSDAALSALEMCDVLSLLTTQNL